MLSTDESPAPAEGFAAIPNWVVRDPDIPAQAKIILLVIASHSGKGGATRLRKETIVEETGLSRATVTRYLGWLEEHDLLVREANFNGLGRGSNTYRPVMFVSQMPDLGIGSVVAEPRLSAIRTPAPSDPAEEELLKKIPSRTPPTPHGGRESGPTFDQFWAEYPRVHNRRTAKASCRAIWEKITPEQRVLAMTQLVYVKSTEDWTKNGGQYVTNSLTWLKRKPWEDDPPGESEEERRERIRQVVRNRGA